ncbi:uncharacterized protein LOC127808147 isoform X2 [Diospyros lotus]|uniref:uncharacterized protein LOC127808147 isoform X2 n=1 Tax=Diospyros lotus TaxID=55363 RepID=UPI00225C1ADD|nr:uncharacterized protein LOC127808147 isoform X2 [Diospyros lotus]
MERNTGSGMLEQHKTHEQVQYISADAKKEGLVSTNQRFFQDLSSSINTNLRHPDFNIPVASRPVLNYSIQTGEEFALEFMRERVNSRQHLIPNPSSDSSSATSYTDLKGILGLSHTGSESGSDISMISSMDKGHTRENERSGSSVHEDRGHYESRQSIPQTPSKNVSSLGAHGYASSEVSDHSSTNIKLLCSLGGKILPRPGDGKLRYVGGETRIIRVSKHISWPELKVKALEFYNQVHTIKYQLPGEDLDALVSVSCDEDLHNMMEECNSVEHGGSQKLRMFLFSSSDLNDSQLGLGNVEGDSETQYVAAVNGMDIGSGKNSFNLGSTSRSNLHELFNFNVEKETGRGKDESAGALPASVTVTMPSLTNLSQPVVLSSSGTYESNPQVYPTQLVDHEGKLHTLTTPQPRENLCDDGRSAVPSSVPLQYGYVSHPSTHSPDVENLVPTPFHGHLTGLEGSAQQQKQQGFHAQDPEMSIKEEKVKSDGIVQTMRLEKINSLHKISVSHYMPREVSEAKFAGGTGISLLPTEKHIKQGEAVRHAMPPHGGLSKGHSNELYENDHFNASGKPFAPGYAEAKADSAKCSYLEQQVLPQRVFVSEHIPRQQAEVNHLKRSDDPHLLIWHARSSDLPEQMIESADELPAGTVASHMERSPSSVKLPDMNPQVVKEGLVQSRKCNQTVSYFEKMKSTISEEPFDSKLQNPVSRPVVVALGDDQEMVGVLNNYKDQFDVVKETFVNNHAIGRQGPSGKQQENSASIASESHYGRLTVKKNSENDTGEYAESFSQVGNQIRAPSNRESSCVSTVAHGDILIDINDRFPPDFLSDIVYEARNSEDLAGINPLHDETGLSLNMENQECKHQSFLQKLVQGDVSGADFSLKDQDRLGFSSPLTNIKGGGGTPIDYSFPPSKTEGIDSTPADSHTCYTDKLQLHSSSAIIPKTMDLHPENSSQFNGDKSTLLHCLVNPRTPEPEIEIIKNEDLEELKELGSGTFGTVYHGKWRGSDVAIKRIKKTCFTGQSSEQERLSLEFWREADILSKLHHPNVVAFYGVVQDGPGETLATVTEFMVNGSLRHVLLRKDRQLNHCKRLIIAMDAAFGMEYLHSRNIVHFDLKCDNLLVNLKDPSRPICKVGDFGLSKIKRNTLVTGGVRGTLPWMAPELLNGTSSKVSEKVDVFSFGIVLWEILTGEEPYANMHYGAIIGGIVSNTLRPPLPSPCDPEWKFLMEQCWAPDPVARPSFREIARRLRMMYTLTKPQANK